MLRKVEMEGVKLPRLYIAEDKTDADLAKKNGLPYVRWTLGMEELIKFILRPVLEDMFPYINWNKVLGKHQRRRTSVIVPTCGEYDELSELPDGSIREDYDNDEVLKLQYDHDLKGQDKFADEDKDYVSRSSALPNSYRAHCNGRDHNKFSVERVPILQWVTDENCSVDINVLQSLGLLPQFIGDITECIRSNIGNRMYWTEGYNKKLSASIGKFNGKPVLSNLIILDISWSIPEGIAATMITLIDTLREQCNADLIITSAKSGYYPMGAKLPSPQTIRHYYGRSNECIDFAAIIKKHIAGREFGHVISFGDYDSPCSFGKFVPSLTSTKVHAVHHYHTTDKAVTGYAAWVHDACPDVETHYNTEWCKIMRGV